MPGTSVGVDSLTWSASTYDCCYLPLAVLLRVLLSVAAASPFDGNRRTALLRYSFCSTEKPSEGCMQRFEVFDTAKHCRNGTLWPFSVASKLFSAISQPQHPITLPFPSHHVACCQFAWLEQTQEPTATWMGKSGGFKSLDHHWTDAKFATAGDSVDLWDHARAEPTLSYQWGADSNNCVRWVGRSR